MFLIATVYFRYLIPFYFKRVNTTMTKIIINILADNYHKHNAIENTKLWIKKNVKRSYMFFYEENARIHLEIACIIKKKTF